jgi:hypothetical protein
MLGLQRPPKENISTLAAEALHFPRTSTTNLTHTTWRHLRPNRKHTVSAPTLSDQDLPTTPAKQPHQTPSDIQDLKLQIKTLFEQLGKMLNLLNSVLSKLP